MAPTGLLLCSQENATGVTNPDYTCLSHSFQLDFNLILPKNLRLQGSLLPPVFPTENFVFISGISNARYMHYPTPPPSFSHRLLMALSKSTNFRTTINSAFSNSPPPPPAILGPSIPRYCTVPENRTNPLKTKRRLLNLKTQFVLRSKHFSSWL
jgi:hypothetical protein